MPYVQEKFNEILALLSLFRESAISWIGYKIETQSFDFLYSGEMGTSRSMSGSPILLIRDSEQESLDNFITTLEPLMSKIKLRKQPETPIGIAFQRYLDSLQKVSKVEEKILDAIMGLESLYLDNQPEARFRLAIRTARLLGLLNEDSQSVYQKTCALSLSPILSLLLHPHNFQCEELMEVCASLKTYTHHMKSCA